jgi:hypothetical protein
MDVPEENWLLPQPLVHSTPSRVPVGDFHGMLENQKYWRGGLPKPRLKTAFDRGKFVLHGGEWPIPPSDNVSGQPRDFIVKIRCGGLL